MRNPVRVTDEETRLLAGQRTGEGEIILPVAEDWYDVAAKANKAANVIDKHLDFEEGFQGIEMRPSRLCPEQKVALMTDLSAVSE